MNVQVRFDGKAMTFSDKTYEIRIIADSNNFVETFKEVEQAIQLMKHLSYIHQVSVVEVTNNEN